MACHVSSCMTLLKPINIGVPIQFWGAARFSSWEQPEEGGREKRKGGEEKRKGGKERRNGGKEKKRKGKKKREEERGGREEKEKRKGRSVAQ